MKDLLCGGVFYWLARRRGLLTVTLACLTLANVLWGGAKLIHLLGPDLSPGGLFLWVLLVLGITIRIWGAGNLRKNKEVTRTGIYRMVRHPLYLGNCLLFLVFFASMGGGVLRPALCMLVLFCAHYPAMIQEEARLAREYPGQFADHCRISRLVPDLRALPEALASDCFSWSRVRANYGARTLWALVLLPLLPEGLAVLQGLV